ncbi:MAG: TRAP transporter large permease [Alphaproteobacteria bacterium]|nr:TRAP transporter large permease [Alphaproteobacteria bacterium]MCZ6849376.1 TRAP transporter large permease [Alphaproteobacteria bacterium]
MTPLGAGLIVVLGLLFCLGIGTPIAFALGFVSIVTLMIAEGPGSLSILAETFFGGIASFSLLSIPMFILMGAAVSSSPAGKDLYDALDRWLNRVPGGLVLSNLGACAIFAALSGSSPATCAAIGKMGIPEMTGRGYPKEVAAGSIAAGGTLGILIPPSITLIVYGISTETSIGRLFMAGILPGIMLTGLFMAWTIYYCRRRGVGMDDIAKRFTMKERFAILPRVLPFLAIVVGILYVLYGGVATPSEAAGVGAVFCLLLVVVIYRIWNFATFSTIFRDTLRDSVMIMMIIGASELFSFTLSSLFVTQSIAEWIAGLAANKWVIIAIVNVFLLIAGFFLPPVAVIVMTAPILLPIITQAGFDPYWFAIVLTINMEIGLITPPVGLNLYVINSIAPDISLRQILMGSLPYVFCMVTAIIILCIVPEIATWLPNLMMGQEIQ